MAPLFARSPRITCIVDVDRSTSDLPNEWQTWAEDCHTDAYSLDRLAGDSPCDSDFLGDLAPRSLPVPLPFKFPEHLFSPSSRSSCSSQGMSDDGRLSPVDRRSFSSNDSEACLTPSSRAQRLTTQSVFPLQVQQTPTVIHRPGHPQRCRPIGKYPLCPEGRCTHAQSWARVRSKRSLNFYICKYCGLGWCTEKMSPAMAHVPNLDRFAAAPEDTAELS